jgi:hypothetical protein
MELVPQCVVGDVCVPEDGARVSKRRLLPFRVAIGVLELQEVVVIGFGESLPSSLDGSLNPSILTRDRFRDVDPAELLDLVIEDPVQKRGTPRLGEGVENGGDV